METRYKEHSFYLYVADWSKISHLNKRTWGSFFLNKFMVAPKWGRITDSHLLKLHLEHFTQI